LSSEKVYVEAQEHNPDHESSGTEQVHAQSSYTERKMEGVIHIPHHLQKQSLDIQPRSYQEDKHTPILSHSMLIQRQRSTKTSDDGNYRPWSPILQRQFVDSNPGLSFGTLHGSWNKVFCPGKQSQETGR